MNEARSGPDSINIIEFNCPQCRSRLRVGRQLAGGQAKCPKCGQVAKVPEQVAGASANQLSREPNPSVSSQTMVSQASNEIVLVPEILPDIASRPEQVANNPTKATANPASQAVSGADTATHRLYQRITQEIKQIFVGQDDLVLGSLVALFSGGHVLIESVPGLGKTLFVRTLGKVLGCQFGRIQFTADLMPSDITGAPIFNLKTQEFDFRPGPVFTQLLLADEINRSPAKTHAALLEIMQEKRVTVDGKTHHLELPFLVMATQNPIESEGTYNLPEAQLDRFMFKLKVDYPTAEQEAKILLMHGGQAEVADQLDDLIQVTNPEEILKVTQETSQVRVDPLLVNYINKIVRTTRQWPQFYMGASPRAGIGLMQAARTLAAFSGRDFVVPDDVVAIALPALRHRVILTAEAEVEGQNTDQLLSDLIRTIEVPRLK